MKSKPNQKPAMHLHKRLQDVLLTPSNNVTGMDYFSFTFLKSYIYELFRGTLKHPKISILRMVARDGNEPVAVRPVSISDVQGQSSLLVLDENIHLTMLFDNHSYEVILSTFKGYDDVTSFTMQVMGLENDAKKSSRLIDELERGSLLNSPFRNKIITISENRNQAQSSSGLEIITIEPSTLEDIFVPAETQKKLNLFVDCVKNFDKIKRPIRFLLSGKPGTGKTKIIRSIANSIEGKATFIMANGSDMKMSRVFDFAKKFNPVVVCIDDVDLLVGSRDENTTSNKLGRFLQYLDGFVESNIFILASTNDKNLVDAAASRPGRFDFIIDVQSVSPTSYLDLIKNKTTSTKVLALFDESVISALESKKVTGAFIANLVNHLELYDTLQPENLTKELVFDCIAEMYNGFYKQPISSEKALGFAA